MFGNEQGEIRVVRLFFGVFEAVSVDGNNTVGVLVYDYSVRIHTERAHFVLVFFGGIYYLAFVKFVGDMFENFGGKFHPHADINPVGMGGYAQFTADRLHPLASASACRNNAVTAVINFIRRNLETAVRFFDIVDVCIKVKIYFTLQLVVHIRKHFIIYIGAEVSYLCIEKVKLVLRAGLVKARTCRGIEFGFVSAVFYVDFIDVFHKLQSAFFAEMLVQASAEIVGYIVFSV